MHSLSSCSPAGTALAVLISFQIGRTRDFGNRSATVWRCGVGRLRCATAVTWGTA